MSGTTHRNLAGRVASRRRTTGQALVEFALVLPIMVILLLTVLDLGRLFYSQIAINNAAREAAFQASLPASPAPGGTFDSTHAWSTGPTATCAPTTDAITCRALLEFSSTPTNWFIHPTPSDVTLACSSGAINPSSCASGMGSLATVTVKTDFSLWSPWMAVFFGGHQDVTLAAASTSQTQTFPSPGVVVPTPTPTPIPTATPSPTPTPTPTPIVCDVPSAGFTAVPLSGTSPLTVTFTDTSTSSPLCPITSWTFSWDDGTSGSTYYSAPGSVTHTFLSTVNNGGHPQAGKYAATLTVTNSGGSNTSGKQTITANP